MVATDVVIKELFERHLVGPQKRLAFSSRKGNQISDNQLPQKSDWSLIMVVTKWGGFARYGRTPIPGILALRMATRTSQDWMENCVVLFLFPEIYQPLKINFAGQFEQLSKTSTGYIFTLCSVVLFRARMLSGSSIAIRKNSLNENILRSAFTDFQIL